MGILFTPSIRGWMDNDDPEWGGVQGRFEKDVSWLASDGGLRTDRADERVRLSYCGATAI